MKWNEAFVYTLREDPAEAELLSHKLMLRAGMIQKIASGIYTYLPLGLRVIRKIEDIIRQEMATCGAVELLMPMVVPAELWQESGRWNYYGAELLRFTDRKQMQFCLGPTHEEVIVDVVRRSVRSYRDLPVCLYQIQSKFRDEVRPRYGLMRGREFIMKDAYSFHLDEESLDKMYWTMHAAYTRIFKRCGLDFRPVQADSGTIGGSVTHEFHVLADSGEDTIASCTACEYAANIEKAVSHYDLTVAATPSDKPAMAEIATPHKKTIEDVSAFLKITAAQTVKTLIYQVNGGDTFVAVCIRGDKAVNEAKLRAALGADVIAIPAEAECAKRGMQIGYLGPFEDLKSIVLEIIADASVARLDDVVCGANKEGYHVQHVSIGRDCTVSRFVDIGFVAAGDPCPNCDSGKIALCKGIEVGQVFKLGQKYSKTMNLSVQTESGESQAVTMGCYGIGVGRTAAAAIEQNHDKDGIVWPFAIAPFGVLIALLDPLNQQASDLAKVIHDGLTAAGIDVLLDDRTERPGVKFKDADLIGCPVRVTIGDKGLKAGIVEVKLRNSATVDKIPCENALAAIVEMCGKLSNS